MIINTQFKVACQPERVKKDLIVLHFTAGGSASGAIAWWNANNAQREAAKAKNPAVSAWKLGTPWIIDRDANATIFNVFDDRCWAYGLGIKNPSVEQRCVQVEIVNYGPCRMDEQGRYYPKDLQGKGVYVLANQIKRADYREEKYFQAFTEPQYKSLGQLLRKISADHNIPLRLPPMEKRGKFDPQWAMSWRGICDHTNFLEAGKWDMGPAFDWGRLALEIL